MLSAGLQGGTTGFPFVTAYVPTWNLIFQTYNKLSQFFSIITSLVVLTFEKAIFLYPLVATGNIAGGDNWECPAQRGFRTQTLRVWRDSRLTEIVQTAKKVI